MNRLYYGDNLHVLRDTSAFPDACVDLIYLDPPFNSKRDYNLLFKSPKLVGRVPPHGEKGTAASGAESDETRSSANAAYNQAQITAFEDSWHWGEQAEREFDELLHQPNTDVAEMMKALRAFLGENDMMAYLTMMANRLLQLHRVLKPTGSLYLHCDPTASHYLKIVLDGVFGKLNYRNEIVWKRTSSHNDPNRFGKIHDVLFLYTKTDAFTFNSLKTPLNEEYVEKVYSRVDENGRRYRLDNISAPGGRGPIYEWGGKTQPWRYTKENMERLYKEGRIKLYPDGTAMINAYVRYLDESEGQPIQDWWDDIGVIAAPAKERLGYPTQKPMALLERIIAASSNEGDVVLDPFCGCGTAVHAAQKLKRQWIGIDITHLAISLIEKRLKQAFPPLGDGTPQIEFEVHGTPKDVESARDLASRKPDGKYQFQWWAVSLVDAQPFQGKKKGADTGIDGIKFFRDVDQKDARKIVVSVKGGENLKADDVRSVMAVRERDGAEIALFISLEEPTKGMVKDAATAGFYESPNGKKYPRVQLLTIAGLLSGNERAEHPDYLPDLNFKKAKQEATGEQKKLL